MVETTGARPLDIRPAVPIGTALLQRLIILQQFDLGPIQQRVLHDHSLPVAWVEPALLEFRRYLALRLLVPEPTTLFSPLVDEVWHTTIMHTRLYEDLCQRALDRFLQHDPRIAHYPVPLPSTADPTAQWRNFQAAYERFWGALTDLWLMARPAVSGTESAQSTPSEAGLHLADAG